MTFKGTLETLPTSYSQSTLRRRTDSIRSNQRAGKERSKGILVFVSLLAILLLVPLTYFTYLRLVSGLSRRRPSLSRATISDCSRAHDTQSFFSRRAHNNSLPSPAALPSPFSISDGLQARFPTINLVYAHEHYMIHQPEPRISLTSALWSTLMQQWVRGYLQISQRWYAPYMRDRIQAFSTEGIDRFGLPATAEALKHAEFFFPFAPFSITVPFTSPSHSTRHLGPLPALDLHLVFASS